jgi:CRISPR-associated protein Cas2
MKSGMREMWIIAMFDLPTTETEEKKEYTRFRKFLLNDGFKMMQYSVYIRHCGSHATMETHINRIVKNLPLKGKIQIIKLTDKQVGDISTYLGLTKSKPIESLPQFIFI